MSIQVTNLRKRFGRTAAVDDVTLTIPDGSLMALVGPSGSGKTTLLRIIAGLEHPDSGTVLLGGRDVTRVGVRERGVGFVFQHYALFRHLTVFENIAFGLEVRPRKTRPTKAEIRDKVQSLLMLIRLEDLAQRLPSQLSGGQRQRVALARALAVEPQVLLLDEPFGALDAKVRQELRRWLRRLHDEVHITSVFVTHDQEEALEVADQVVVINHGRIEQQGTPEDVYQHPATPFVHHFLGNVNIFHGRIAGGRATVGGLELQTPTGTALDEGSQAVAYVRPHDIAISRTQEPGTAPATVTQINATGPLVRIELERTADQQRFEAQIPRDEYVALAIATGNHVFFSFRQFRVYSSSVAGTPAATEVDLLKQPPRSP
jgi:sulfate/thiosulfate transport system ATP-binding protein